MPGKIVHNRRNDIGARAIAALFLDGVRDYLESGVERKGGRRAGRGQAAISGGI
jgi:hypothetical protein